MQSETGYGGQQIGAEKDASDTDPDAKPASRFLSSRRVAKQERARQQALVIAPSLFLPLRALLRTQGGRRSDAVHGRGTDGAGLGEGVRLGRGVCRGMTGHTHT
jgi:hypothetical protein